MIQPESTERCPRCAEAETLKRISDSQAHEAWIERDGALARLAEAEKERDDARRQAELWARREGALVERGIRADSDQLSQLQAAEERAAQALDILTDCGFTDWQARATAIAALSGESTTHRPQPLDKREREVMEAWRTYFGELSEILFPGAPLVGWKHIIARVRALREAAKGRAPEAPQEAVSKALKSGGGAQGEEK